MSARPAASSFSGAAGSDGRDDLHVEPGLRELAALLRHVDPDVVGVRQVVEDERQLLRLRRAGGVVLRAARAERERRREQRDGEQDGEGAAGTGHARLRSLGSAGPRDEQALGEGEEGEEQDGERGEQRRRPRTRGRSRAAGWPGG